MDHAMVGIRQAGAGSDAIILSRKILNLFKAGVLKVKREGHRTPSITASCAFLIAIGLQVNGCATMKVVSPDQLNGQRFTEAGTPVAHLYIDNWGIYLFKYIPIVTGNLDMAGRPQISRFFTHNVRMDLLIEKLTEESRRRDGTIITDLRTRDRSYWIPLTLFFWLNEFEVSGNASRHHSLGPNSLSLPQE
jgi:hypothetical protein